ncbi:MAG: DNA recombination/repair protein RecA, partial [Oscillospiraceae bacterium]
VRLDVRRIETIKVGNEMVGNRTRAKVVKNKVSPPFKEGEFDIMYGRGISKAGELLDLAVKLDIIQKSGAWFNCGELRLGQGRDNVKKYLEDNPEFSDGIEKQVRESADKLATLKMKPSAKEAVKAKTAIISSTEELDVEVEDE